jgi:hypothetical protein
MTKILIYLAIWKRPEITELCFMGIDRMKEHPDYTFETLAVISEESMISLCEKYGVKWIMHENLPLGKKKNVGLQKAREFEFDFLMEIGSDDLILNDLLDVYKKFHVKYDFFGIGDCAFVDTESGSCRRYTSSSTYGAGRMISRKALEAMDFVLWPDKLNKGLDNQSVFSLYKKGFKYWQVPDSNIPLVIDVKSETNIWKFNHLLGEPFDLNILLEKLSLKEIEHLKQCWQVNIKSETLTEQ